MTDTPRSVRMIGRHGFRPNRRQAILLLVLPALALTLILAPAHSVAMLMFALDGLVEVTPYVVPGIVISAWMNASGSTTHMARALDSGIPYPVLLASLAGAISPVCGASILPVMVGFLSSGVPLAPVMAFWLSSPITDPAMLFVTSSMLGLEFAIGKTLAAFGTGLLGGFFTLLLVRRDLVRNALRITLSHDNHRHPSSDTGFEACIWRDSVRLARFRGETVALAKLILLCLAPAFAAEYWLHQFLSPADLAGLIGRDSILAVPIAAIAGAPAYIDGYAALPLARVLIENGLSQGAVMAFMVSGGLLSIWGAIVIFPVLRFGTFMLFIGTAMASSLIAGWTFDFHVGLD